jgi:hypothetical protein
MASSIQGVSHFSAPIKSVLVFVHRWMGVALCLLFLMWFLSGMVMMYWTYPEVTTGDRLSRAQLLDAPRIRLSPQEAYALLETKEAPSEMRLEMFDRRPAYNFDFTGEKFIVYADDGQMQTEFPPEMALRIAAAWSGQPPATAIVEKITDADQWTVPGQFSELRPLLKYVWPDGEEVYVSTVTGEVVQYTTRASRVGAYFGAIPHWLYFTPLRKHANEWAQLVIWAAGLGTIVTLLGIIVGVWMYSPSKRFQYEGAPSSLPYAGQKRWHSIQGLFFGWIACTWVFSGMLSMDPFPKLQHGEEAARARVAAALEGEPLEVRDFNVKLPREALAELDPEFHVKELTITSFAGEPFYLATAALNQTRIIPVHGESATEFDAGKIIQVMKNALQPLSLAEARLMTEYDAYYQDRQKQRPLPVIYARVNDDENSTYYVDPKTARIVQSYNSRSRWNRWLYHGLHSIDFPLLYKRRPLWDIVVLILLLGGASLCVTALLLAGGVLRRKLIPPARDRNPGNGNPRPVANVK